MSNEINVAVVGATTLVGETLIQLLDEREFPIAELFPLADEDDAGGRVEFKKSHKRITDWERFDFTKVKLAFFCAGAEVANALVPKALAAGCLVIDQSPRFRQEADVPLVVPEVNGASVANRSSGLIALPSCSAIALGVALKPIHDAFGIEQIEVTTLQAVSGRGREGVEELATQTVDLLNMRPMEPKLFSKQIAFNLIPQIEELEESGYSGEEMKIVREVRRLLGEADLPVHVTAIRVPVFYGHSAAVHVVTRRACTPEQVRGLWEKAPSLEMLDDPEEPATPVSEATGQDGIWVGRLRQDLDDDHALAFWLTTDNLRKGGALNAVQVAEIMTKGHS